MKLLKGPADAGNFRVKVGRYGDRWYTDPLPTCPIAEACDWHGPSVSTTKPPFANKYVTMKSIADMPAEEWQRLAGLEADARYEAIKAHEKVASRVNMDRGTIVHARAEGHLQGWAGSLPVVGTEAARQQAEKFFPALDSFLDTYQPELIAAEVPCLHRTLNGVGYGGTADAFVGIDGEVWAVDWKSRNSDHDAYLEEGAQGGAYIGAEYMIVAGDDGEPMRVKVPEVSGVLIVSIREDGYRAFPIDRDEAIKAYGAMHAWWVAQRHYVDSGAKGRPWAPRASATPQIDVVAVPTKDDVIARYNELGPASQERFKSERTARGIDNDDVDALWALVEEVYHWQPGPPPEPSAPAEPPAPKPPAPDDGGAVDEATLAPLGEAFKQLGDTARAWFDDLIAQSRHGHAWEMRPWSRTVRGYELYRGLVHLGLWGEFDAYGDAFNATVLEPLVWAASGCDDTVLFANVTAGVALGSLDAEQAKTFAQLVDDLVANRRQTVIDEATQRWRLEPAA